MKSILLVIYSLNSGGAERVVSRISHLLNDKYKLSVVIFDNKKNVYDCGCELYNLNIPAKTNVFSKIINLIKKIYALRRFKKEHDIDITISFLPGLNLINILSKVNDKIVISIRSYIECALSNNVKGQIKYTILSAIYRRSDAIITCSDEIRNNIIKNYNISANKIHTIYNPFVASEILMQSQIPLPSKYQSFFSFKDCIISVGRIMYPKGYWNLVKSFSLVLKQLPTTGLLIVGEDYERQKLQILIDKLGISKNVMLTGYEKNPFNLIKHCKLYVLSSVYEGFPNALVEAMVCSIPVLSVDCKSGPIEILHPNNQNNSISYPIYAKYGVLAKPFSSKEDYDYNNINQEHYSFSELIIDLLRDKQMLKHYSELSYERSQDFGENEFKRKLTLLFDSILL